MPFGLGFFATAGGAAPLAAGDYDLLTTTVLGTASASVTFDVTPYTAYKHLQVRFVARSTSSAGDTLYSNFQFNADTGSNYAWHSLRGNGSNVNSFAGSTQTYGRSGLVAGSTETANAFGVSVLDILDAYSTTKYKTTRFLAGQDEIYLGSSLWQNTNALTEIKIIEGYSSNFVVNSRFSLYGLKG